jgi:hypothetical protein
MKKECFKMAACRHSEPYSSFMQLTTVSCGCKSEEQKGVVVVVVVGSRWRMLSPY